LSNKFNEILPMVVMGPVPSIQQMGQRMVQGESIALGCLDEEEVQGLRFKV
jgi:hypothetical protein